MKQTEDMGACYCSACGARFRRLSGFETHRDGKIPDRRCLTSAQMEERGFKLNLEDRWYKPSDKPFAFRRQA